MTKIKIATISIIFFFVGSAILPLPWNDSINNAVIDLQFKLRGERRLSDKIVIVFIGPEDIKALNGWPITRDYYGYITHILKQSGAKVIGFSLLFNTRNPSYPEYDESLSDFFSSAQNICLPMTFSEMTQNKNQIPIGKNPSVPLEIFRKQVAGIGFSDLYDETIIRKMPLVVKHNDSLLFSFGFELARLYLGGLPGSIKMESGKIQISNSDGQTFYFHTGQDRLLRLNHFGDPENVTALSFVELMQTYRSSPDSINLSDKLVLIAVTSPGISPQRVTPLSSAFPAAFFHATVAENLIEQNYLRETGTLTETILIILLISILLVIWRFKYKKVLFYYTVGFLLTYLIGTQIVFNLKNLVLPLFYPVLGYLTTFAFLGICRFREQQRQDSAQNILLKEHIEIKQKQVEEAEKNLTEVHEKLKTELEDKATFSQEKGKLLAEKKQEILKLEKQLRDLQTFSVPEKSQILSGFPEIIYADKSKLVDILNLVSKIGSDNISVLISGETGTGKEIIARAVHQSGIRKHKPFIAVNCGALTETLLESELFGHERGSFTGAQSQRKGRFEIANDGTLFLDEITETTQAFQAKLLRVLQEGTFERVGGEKTVKVDVRIVAASSRALKTEVQNNNFREDLYYRLNGFPISIPPLRDRKSDIPLLANHFLHKFGYNSITGFSDTTMENLLTYFWPGNVRELENVIRRAAILAQSEKRDLIQIQDLPGEIVEKKVQPDQARFQTLEQQILEMLRSLKFSHSAINQTAKALGNRDRGTITEYFRGIVFKNLVDSDFNINQAAIVIAESKEKAIIGKVAMKIDEYLNNLKSMISAAEKNDIIQIKTASLLKGLPKKYHPYLQQVMEHYSQ